MKKLVLASLFFFIPLIANPQLFLSRGNDLEIFFWPLFHFAKDQIENGVFPLWYPNILSGTPLISDPQSPLFYLPNILFLFVSTDLGFLLSFYIHILFGGLGVYFFLKRALKFSEFTAFIVAFVYLANPKLASFVESGHVGLIFAWGWIPYTFYSIWNIIKNYKKRWALLFVASFCALFVLHTITFAVIAIANIAVVVYFLKKKNVSLKKILILAFLGSISLGIVATALLPQVSWSELTNRNFLIEKPDVYPKWLTKREFVEVTFTPWLKGIPNLQSFETEKYYPIGIVLAFLSVIGFLKTNKKLKTFIVISFIPLLLIALNNLSPVYDFLIEQNWYKLMRVSTRVWILFLLLVIFLSAFGLEKLPRIVKRITGALLIIEIIFLSWTYMSKLPNQKHFVSHQTIEKISQDPSIFRVFCLTHCISQKDAVLYNLELISGYSTLIQKNYSQQAWQFSGDFWDYYTLAIPPFSITANTRQKPDINALGHHNTKYILSPYDLTSQDLTLISKTEGYYLYSNERYQPRAYYINDNFDPIAPAQIVSQTVNEIVLNTENKKSNKIILANTYSPGWKAKSGSDDLILAESPNALLLINLKDHSNNTVVTFSPDSFEIGKIVTFISLLVLVIFVAL